MLSFKKFTNETLADATRVACSVFGDGVHKLLAHLLANPLLNEIEGSDSGEVVYEDCEPIGFEGIVPRRLYYGNRPIIGCVGSTICMLPSCRDNLAIVELMKCINAPRFGSVLFYGNTANRKGMRVNKALGMRVNGPSSWANRRIAVLSWPRFVRYLLFTKIFRKTESSEKNLKNVFPEKKIGRYTVRRMDSIDAEIFNGFWMMYLKENKGLVSSRTAEELEWIFGERIRAGRAIVCGLFDGSEMVGYSVWVGGGDSWSLMDAVVRGNSCELLTCLFKGTLKVLRTCSSASRCYVEGFPDFVQHVLKRLFKIERSLPNNQFGWKFFPEGDVTVPYDELNSPQSWFFGPYDGDLCLGC